MAKKLKLKAVLAIGIVSWATSCQVKISKPTVPDKPKVESAPVLPEVVSTPTEVAPLKTDNKLEQFGIIFAGGGVRTWAYITVLKEIQKYKMPIAAVAGIEWGAVVAGVYAQNISANEVEWELSKFKDLDDWQNFIKKIFEKKSTDNLKIPFGCTSLNLKNQTSYILNKGQLDSLVPFCVPAPGVIKPHADSIASMSDVTGVIQFLKNNGATKIILINGTSTKNGRPLNSSLQSVENQFWIQSNSVLVKKNIGIDEVIDVDINGTISVEDFGQRRNVLNSSLPQAKDQLKKIANRYGF